MGLYLVMSVETSRYCYNVVLILGQFSLCAITSHLSLIAGIVHVPALEISQRRSTVACVLQPSRFC